VLGKLPHYKKRKEINKCIGIGIGEYQKKNIGTHARSLKNGIGASLFSTLLSCKRTLNLFANLLCHLNNLTWIKSSPAQHLSSLNILFHSKIRLLKLKRLWKAFHSSHIYMYTFLVILIERFSGLFTWDFIKSDMVFTCAGVLPVRLSYLGLLHMRTSILHHFCHDK